MKKWGKWIPTGAVALLILVLRFWDAPMNDFFAVLSGALTPLIAIITIYIAYQQKEINRLKVANDDLTNKLKQRLDLYDRRLTVYLALVDMFRAAYGKPDVEREQVYKLHRLVVESYFLFDEDVIQYLRQVENKYNRLQSVHALLEQRTLGLGRERNRLADEELEISNWFDPQLEVSRQVFSKYLSLKELGLLDT